MASTTCFAKAPVARTPQRVSRMVVRCEAAPSPMTRAKQAGIALVSSAALLAASPAFATPDLALGQEVFDNNCAACHAGGQNSVQADKTLEKADLEQYLAGGLSEASIVTQVTNGKNAMPAWGDRLEEDEIESVAAYVYKTATEGGW